MPKRKPTPSMYNDSETIIELNKLTKEQNQATSNANTALKINVENSVDKLNTKIEIAEIVDLTQNDTNEIAEIIDLTQNDTNELEKKSVNCSIENKSESDNNENESDEDESESDDEDDSENYEDYYQHETFDSWMFDIRMANQKRIIDRCSNRTKEIHVSKVYRSRKAIEENRYDHYFIDDDSLTIGEDSHFCLFITKVSDNFKIEDIQMNVKEYLVFNEIKTNKFENDLREKILFKKILVKYYKYKEQHKGNNVKYISFA